MNGFTFYLEYPSLKDKRKATRKTLGNHSGNVMAVFGDWFSIAGHYYKKECVSALQNVPNSVVCCSSACDTYIKENGKRISEKQAREIHPNLFTYLDSNN